MQNNCPQCLKSLKRKTQKYCSRSCHARSRKGEKNSNWKGGINVFDSYGRYVVYTPDHPKAINGRYVLRARLVMEKHLGRYLEDNEIVHHINEDAGDDTPENLQIVTRSDHSLLHGHHLRKDPITGRFA